MALPTLIPMAPKAICLVLLPVVTQAFSALPAAFSRCGGRPAALDFPGSHRTTCFPAWAEQHRSTTLAATQCRMCLANSDSLSTPDPAVPDSQESSSTASTQEAGQAAEQPSDPPVKQVYIEGIPFQATEAHLKEFLGDSNPTAIYMPTFADSNNNKGVAIVEFSSSEDADRAVGLTGTPLFDRWMKVARCRTPIHQINQVKLKKLWCDDGTEQRLRAGFKECGEITSLSTVLARGETSPGWGTAVATFESAEAAKKALDMDGSELAGRKLDLLPRVEVKWTDANLTAINEGNLRKKRSPRAPRPTRVPQAQAVEPKADAAPTEAVAAIAADETAESAPEGEEEEGNRNNKRVFITGVPYNVTSQELKTHLSSSGVKLEDIRELYMPKHKNGRFNRGLAILGLSSLEATTAAIAATNGTEFGGRTIWAQPWMPKVEQEGAGRAARERRLNQASEIGAAAQGSLKTFVSNVAFKATQKDLLELFARNGASDVEAILMPEYKAPDGSVPPPSDKKTPTHRGRAWIVWGNAESRNKALALNGLAFQGRQLIIKMSTDRRAVLSHTRQELPDTAHEPSPTAGAVESEAVPV